VKAGRGWAQLGERGAAAMAIGQWVEAWRRCNDMSRISHRRPRPPFRHPPAMRRIPRPPLRALEPPRPRASPCRHGGTVCSSAAALSTSATRHFLVPAGKQNKKKHQQFVRRWQKRLLGDSEPIGAHVDPYDPTSPVRIAPEEQGEYEEVLEEAADAVQSRHKSTNPTVPPVYQPATDALRLRCVGDQQWQRRRLEADLAREFEKLTLRTYTPLSLAMASEIEVLTGTPYTLRDENLLMAQMVHHATNRPYTHHNFGVHTKPATPRELKHRFDRAVAEVFARKQAGLDLDMFKLANQGVYDAPRWVQDIKVCLTENGEITLSYPKDKSAEDFLQVMQTVPSLDESVPENDELLVDEATAEDIEAGVEATDPLNSVMPLEQPSTMDPETPAYKRAAVVKADTEKKPFDFMSNRPTPRAKPVEEPKSSEVIETEVLIDNHESATMSSVPEAASPPTTPESISQASISSTPSTTEDSLYCPVDNDANANTGAETLTATDPDTCLDVPAVKMAKWRGVPITDVALKFAVGVTLKTV